MVYFGTCDYARFAGNTINQLAFTNRHFRDRGQIWTGNEGDQVGCKLKIPQCPWGILSLRFRDMRSDAITSLWCHTLLRAMLGMVQLPLCLWQTLTPQRYVYRPTLWRPVMSGGWKTIKKCPMFIQSLILRFLSFSPLDPYYNEGTAHPLTSLNPSPAQWQYREACGIPDK